MHAFSIPPTQYEIESLLFPHPDVRRMKDARGSGPQRHSLHFATPLKKATREREERTRLQKGHRRWHSHGQQILHDGPRKEEETERNGQDSWQGNFKTVREWSEPHGHHSKLITEPGEDETARSKSRSAGYHVVTGSGGMGQERTKSDDSRQSMFGPKHHFSAFRLPPGVEERSSGDGKKHHRRRRSQGHLYSMLAAEAHVEREVKELSRGSSNTRSSHGRSQSQLYESLYSMPFQTVGGKKDSGKGSGSGSGSGSDSGVRPSDILSPTSSPSQHPSQHPPAPKSPIKVSRNTRGARAHHQLRKPTSHGDRQTVTVLKPHSTDFVALLRSLSCRSLTMEDLSVPFHGAVTQNMSGGHQGSSEGQHPQESSWHQDAAGSDGEEEPGPAFLGSLDYHNFLHGSSNAGVTSSSNAPPRAGTDVSPKSSKLNKNEAALDDINGPRTAVNAKSSQKSPASKPARKVSQSLAHKPFSGALNHTANLRERRCEALAAQACSPEALRKIPRLGLSVMTDIPVSLTSSTTSLSSSLSTAPLLRDGALRSIPSGPLSTISCNGIDPDKLQPFIGPLLPQQPPPNRPLPQLPFPSPVKRRVPTQQLFAKMAARVDGSHQGLVKGDAKTSMEETVEQRVDEKKGKGLRKKISRFFTSDQPTRPADVTACATYQPLSLTTSQDSQRASFSDIFDDVYNAARSSLKSVRGSQNSGRNSFQKPDRTSISARSGDFLPSMSSQHHGAHESTQATTTPPSTPFREPPALIDHPALRSDRAMRDEPGLINDKFVAVPGSSTPPILPLEIPALSVSRSRPAQIDNTTPLALPRSALSAPWATGRARLVKEESQATITTDGPQDIDPSPAFDRTVDLTWYRTAREEGRAIICSIPRPSSRFEHALTLFVAQYAKGRSFSKYDGKKRFPYFDLPNTVRFEIMRHVIADTHNGKPILLNSKRQASPAWPDDAFSSLGSVLKPLQAIMWACPRLRADAMVVLLLTRKFHVIFSPFVKECSQPLPTTWLFRYLHLMQDVRLELDMTRLGFGYSWESTAVDSRIHDIGALVRQFTAEILTRNAANPMGCLTIHCRRYFGYRQGPNTLQGRGNVYKHPLIGGEEDEPGSLAVPGQGDTARNDGQPRNHNRRASSLPPSAAKPYSGHFRHHADLPHRVPFVTEDQLSVANPLRTLAGRVDSVRMVGFSEQWTYATHLKLWPEAERNSVPDAFKHRHIDRQTPSRHLYAAPSHAVYLDYGIDHGVHRYPPLPDSEPMVCVDYDRENGLYVELGSGKVVSVTENGAEFACRSSKSPTPCRASAPGPGPGHSTTPAHRESLTSVPRPSRIPTPSSHGNISPLMQAMRKGTPVKAAAVLGLPGTMITSSEAEHLTTPTRRRIIRNASAETEDEVAHAPARNTHLGKLASRSGRSSSVASAFKPGKLAAKRSLHFLGKAG